jgi:flagellar basal-body rod protein FlgB
MDIGTASINEVAPRIERSDYTKMRVDENNVDMDIEMANLAKNTIIYNTLIQKISGDFRRIKNVINEGRR